MLAIIANYLFNVFIQFKSCAYFIVNQLILFLLYKWDHFISVAIKVHKINEEELKIKKDTFLRNCLMPYDMIHMCRD